MTGRLLVAERRLSEAPGAEAIVFDDPGRLAAFESGLRAPRLYLRLCGSEALPALGAAARRAEGVLLASAAGPADLERLGARLAVAEAEHGLADGALRIVALVATPPGVLSLPALRPLPRLAGIACDPFGLAAGLGCAPGAPAIVHARAATVLAAAACAVPAILAVRGIGEVASTEGFAGVLLDAVPAGVPT